MTGLFSIAVKNAVNALASFNELCYNLYRDQEEAQRGGKRVYYGKNNRNCMSTKFSAQPFPQNCEFYNSYETAIRDGYHPCKRCKPDIFFIERTKSI